jgi:putative colanic acid biosysnthesis UDP-glucose lipid carrier transferase
MLTDSYPLSDSVLFKGRIPIGILALLWTFLPSLVSPFSFYLTMTAYHESFGTGSTGFLVVLLALCTLVMQSGRSLVSQLNYPRVSMTLEILGRWAVLLIALLFIGFLTRSTTEFPRRIALTWAALTPSLIVSLSFALQSWLRQLTLDTTNHRRVLIAGCNETSLRLAKNIRKNPALCMSVAGFFDDRSRDRLDDPSVTVLGGLASLADYARAHAGAVIFVALPIGHMRRVMDLLDSLKDTTASIYYVPDFFSFDLIQSRTADVAGIPVVAMCETPLHGARGLIKRVFDLVFGSMALLLLAPVMMAIAVLITLSSRGPIIFAQRRYGLDGQEIKVYKFRTMTVTDDGVEVQQATKDDPRITPLGRILRRYSLDELPQLFNVLQGEMSLVGPRPHAVAHNETYRKLIKSYMVRHKVQPGITGLAQISGYRGETRDIGQMKGRVDLDLEYLRRWSIGLDFRILARTVFQVLFDHKAY